MSGAVLAAAVSGALGGAAVSELMPDLAAGARAAFRRGYRPAAGGGSGSNRLVPVGLVLGLLLLILSLPLPALLLGAGPLALRTVHRTRAVRRRVAVAAGAPLVARAIADALDAGYGVRRAIGEASRATGLNGPAAEELRRIAARLDAGDPLPTALDAWRTRTDEPAHRMLVAGLLLHGEAGGELSVVLREQAAALERARRQTAEAQSAIVQARTAARIVGGVPAVIVVAVVVLAPGTVRQVTATLLGTALVVAAVALQGMALVAVRRLTTGLGR